MDDRRRDLHPAGCICLSHESENGYVLRAVDRRCIPLMLNGLDWIALACLAELQKNIEELQQQNMALHRQVQSISGVLQHSDRFVLSLLNGALKEVDKAIS